MNSSWDVIATVALFFWLFGLVCGMVLLYWIRAGRHIRTPNRIILLDSEETQ